MYAQFALYDGASKFMISIHEDIKYKDLVEEAIPYLDKMVFCHWDYPPIVALEPIDNLCEKLGEIVISIDIKGTFESEDHCLMVHEATSLVEAFLRHLL